MEVRRADLSDPQVAELIGFHQRAMQAGSPPGASFALDLSGLTDPAVTVLGAWDGDRLAAIGALKRLGADQVEIKSMRTHPDFLRRGIAALLLEALVALAREQGLARLSLGRGWRRAAPARDRARHLETGSGPAFEPALALYRRRGFDNGEAFAYYRLTDFNQCLHLTL